MITMKPILFLMSEFLQSGDFGFQGRQFLGRPLFLIFNMLQIKLGAKDLQNGQGTVTMKPVGDRVPKEMRHDSERMRSHGRPAQHNHDARNNLDRLFLTRARDMANNQSDRVDRDIGELVDVDKGRFHD